MASLSSLLALLQQYNKAIVAFLVPLIVGVLVHFGFPNSDDTTKLVGDVVTALIALIAVYRVPNKTLS